MKRAKALLVSGMTRRRVAQADVGPFATVARSLQALSPDVARLLEFSTGAAI